MTKRLIYQEHSQIQLMHGVQNHVSFPSILSAHTHIQNQYHPTMLVERHSKKLQLQYLYELSTHLLTQMNQNFLFEKNPNDGHIDKTLGMLVHATLKTHH